MAASEAVTNETLSEEALDDSQDGQPGQDTDGKRDRSTIEFPYGNLDDAVEIAKGVNQVGGSSCEWDQLAAKFNQVSTGGGCRLRLLTAKVFGLVRYSQGKVTLTPLGSKLCDPKQEKAAKAEAFLAVPLYRAVYDKFKGGSLPPLTGLEAEMVTLGVAKKQTGKARQVFQRSAMQAGFFWSGQDRLVMPATGNGGHTQIDGHVPEEKKKHKHDDGDGGDDGGNMRHPLIEGLIKTLKKLPPEDQQWPIEARKKWLQTAANIFDLVYSGEDSSSLKIEIQKDSAN